MHFVNNKLYSSSISFSLLIKNYLNTLQRILIRSTKENNNKINTIETKMNK